MRAYLIIIEYKDHDRPQYLGMTDTPEKINEWCENTLINDNIVRITSQHIAVLTSNSYEKSTEETPQRDPGS